MNIETQRELWIKTKNGDLEARNELIKSCWHYALSFLKKHDDDLRQEILVGLINAVDNFDPSRGSLITIVKFYVKQQITTHLRNSRIIRLPQHAEQGKKTKVFSSKSKNIRSLNTIVPGSDEDLQDFLVSSRRFCWQEKENLEDPCLQVANREIITKSKDFLPKRDWDVLISRMKGEELKSIGKRYGLTKQAISKIESRSLHRLQEIYNV